MKTKEKAILANNEKYKNLFPIEIPDWVSLIKKGLALSHRYFSLPLVSMTWLILTLKTEKRKTK